MSATALLAVLAAASGAAVASSRRRRSGSASTGCTVYLLDPDDDIELPGDVDIYHAMDQADALFDHAEIRPSRIEEHYAACMSDSGEILGAAAYGYSSSGHSIEFVFSIVVESYARRRGIAERLVREMESIAAELSQAYDDPVEMRLWVVNPKMARLLDKLGYDSESHRGWSLDEPHYTKALS